MSREEILKRMFKIKKELLEILNVDYCKEKEIYRLYREYLKLYVMVSKKVPTYVTNDIKHDDHNCYFYALDFAVPQVFNQFFESQKANNSLGIVSDNMIYTTLTKDSILDSFYSDMDALKINVYDSDIYSNNSHDGYKVLIYLGEGCGGDYHFARQNIDGSFSHKCGYLGKIKKLKSLDRIDATSYTYDLIKVVEIDKPSLNR